MRIVIQRVKRASVISDGELTGSIDHGLLLLIGIEEADSQEDVDWLANKVVQMRIFSDEEGLMNKSLLDIEGDLLAISQFTLHAKTKKGNRPSFIKAARPDQAIPLYDSFMEACEKLIGRKVERGIFGADMQVELINDGPVTIMIDSKQRD
ncbi:MAG: D-tyrosyl-tRNA(Tyr) deacylase [Flavobacteriales bacterium]|nr:D-tyrosyl-tRNA(Tyr) deacylase [Flavobacteriales bacterium]